MLPNYACAEAGQVSRGASIHASANQTHAVALLSVRSWSFAMRLGRSFHAWFRSTTQRCGSCGKNFRERKGDASPDTEAARARDVLERLARAKPIPEHTAAGEGPVGSHSKLAIANLAARSPAGFDVHPGVAIPAHSRAALQKLLAYLARPPIPASRLARIRRNRAGNSRMATWLSI